MKICINLFERIYCCTIIPCATFFLNTIALIISMIKPQEKIVYDVITLIYIISLIILFISILMIYLLEKIFGKKMIISDDGIELQGLFFSIEEVSSCCYYSCKWYLIPFLPVYKQEQGGLIIFRFENGTVIKEKIFYKDYLKLKETINNIIIK